MINQPALIVEDSFQTAWIEAARLLALSSWGIHNLVVQVTAPRLFDQALHDQVSQFAASVPVLGPKDVAYTIFPHVLYQKRRTPQRLYDAYNRDGGLYDRTQARVRQWGTYFRRMTHYETAAGVVNQLDQTIAAIRSDNRVYKGAFCLVIQVPGGETKRRRGGPCLNYLAVQRGAGQNTQLGLLAVYRSHDFLERAYGNYWGLCNLLLFLAEETNSQPGPLTCVSSAAFVANKRAKLKSFLGTLP